MRSAANPSVHDKCFREIIRRDRLHINTTVREAPSYQISAISFLSYLRPA